MAGSCTSTTAYLRLVRDSHSSLRTLCLQFQSHQTIRRVGLSHKDESASRQDAVKKTKQAHQNYHLVCGRGRWEQQKIGRSPGALSTRQKKRPEPMTGDTRLTKKRLPWQTSPPVQRPLHQVECSIHVSMWIGCDVESFESAEDASRLRLRRTNLRCVEPLLAVATSGHSACDQGRRASRRTSRAA